MRNIYISGHRWTILPVIQLESWWRFTSFRHELARQTVSVTWQSQSGTFLWSCVLGHMSLRSMLPSSSSTKSVASTIPMTPVKKKWSIWIFRKDMLRASLWRVVVNFQKCAVGFDEGPVNLIKMHISSISYEFLICDTHRQLLWWNIVVGNFRPKQTKLLTIALLLTSCWWCDKHVTVVNLVLLFWVGHVLQIKPCISSLKCTNWIKIV